MLHRLYRFFGAEEEWVRPVPRARALRVDGLLAAAMALAALVSIEGMRSLGEFDTSRFGEPGTHLWLVLPLLTLTVRRLHPLTGLGLAITHFLLTALLAPELSANYVLQIYYFFTLFSTVAWARHRRAALRMTLLMALACVVALLSDLVLRGALAQLWAQPVVGVFPPALAALILIAVNSVTFLLASSLAGAMTWWAARREAQARERGITIARQVEQLRERTLIEERLRIARELHDVVGRHVAVIGIQTGAARAVLDSSPCEAAQAMREVEETSRMATRDLRLLLTALRVGPDSDDGHALARVTSIPDLTGTYGALGLSVDVEADGPLEEVPTAVSSTVHRIVQESLTNVCRHSAATTARVRVAVADHGDRTTLHLQVSDPGPSRGDTSGSQMGILGMHERIALHGGTLTAGAADGGGFAVTADLSWAPVVTAR